MSPGEEPDEFEVHARRWHANDGLAQEGAQMVEQFGLDPELAERLHFAAVESGDYDLTMRASADLWSALDKRLAEDPARRARLRDAFADNPEALAALSRGLDSLRAWEDED